MTKKLQLSGYYGCKTEGAGSRAPEPFPPRGIHQVLDDGGEAEIMAAWRHVRADGGRVEADGAMEGLVGGELHLNHRLPFDHLVGVGVVVSFVDGVGEEEAVVGVEEGLLVVAAAEMLTRRRWPSLRRCRMCRSGGGCSVGLGDLKV